MRSSPSAPLGAQRRLRERAFFPVEGGVGWTFPASVLVLSHLDVTTLASKVREDVDTWPELERLFRRYHPRVVRWVNAMGVAAAEAEDVAQEVFLVAHRRLERLEAETAITSWLFGIARRVASNHRRSRAREQARLQHADGPSEVPDPEQATTRREAASILRRFLDDLPEDQRLAFILYEIEGMKGPEVAAILDVTLDNAYARVRLARDKLARVVARHQARRRRADRV